MGIMYKKSITFLVVLIFFTPLVVLSKNFIFPFVVPKVLLFRTLVLVCLACFFLGTKQKKWPMFPKKTPIDVMILLYFLVFLIAVIGGVDWYKSFWDNHERMLGFFTLVHYGFFFLILSSVYRSRHDWVMLFRWFLGAGSIVMLVGVWQYFFDRNFLLNMGNVRVSATLGNAIYYSGYGLSLIHI